MKCRVSPAQTYSREFTRSEFEDLVRPIVARTMVPVKLALADAKLQSAIETAAAGLGLATMRMPSGAGHDAQMVAKIAPIGMIFVPSVGGISHCRSARRQASRKCAPQSGFGALTAAEHKRSAVPSMPH